MPRSITSRLAASATATALRSIRIPIAARTPIPTPATAATSGSVALLADLIHNFGDAATAIPLGIAFLMRSESAERGAGLFVVLAIFVSA